MVMDINLESSRRYGDKSYSIRFSINGLIINLRQFFRLQLSRQSGTSISSGLPGVLSGGPSHDSDQEVSVANVSLVTAA
jgi:hypothetical protein